MLPVDEDDEINLCSVELAEILADGPISRVTKSKAAKISKKAAVAKDEVDNEDEDGIFELRLGVEPERALNQCRQKARDSYMWQ